MLRGAEGRRDRPMARAGLNHPKAADPSVGPFGQRQGAGQPLVQLHMVNGSGRSGQVSHQQLVFRGERQGLRQDVRGVGRDGALERGIAIALDPQIDTVRDLEARLLAEPGFLVFLVTRE